MEIEIDLRKLERGTHTAPIRVQRDGKVFYQRRRVGRKEPEESKESYLSERFNNRFGKESMNKYSDHISQLNDEELTKEFTDLMSEDEEFAKKFISEWYVGGMWGNDGWITKELGLPEENSRWSVKYAGVAKTPGKEDSLMKLYLMSQEHLKRKFPDGTVTLYRGLSGEKSRDLEVGSTIEVNDNNLSSWTELHDVAEFFAATEIVGSIIEIKVPISDVLMTTRLVRAYTDGNDPTEVILIKDKNKGKIISSKDYGEELDPNESRHKADIQWEKIK